MYIHSSFRFFSEEPCFQPRLSLMHPRSILFDGKFRLGNIFPGNKHALRLFSSDNIPSPSITELLSKQRWNKLKSHLQNVSPSTLLQQLLDSKTDPDLTLRYFRWSEKEFNLSHSLELSCKLLHSLANAKSMHLYAYLARDTATCSSSLQNSPHFSDSENLLIRKNTKQMKCS